MSRRPPTIVRELRPVEVDRAIVDGARFYPPTRPGSSQQSASETAAAREAAAVREADALSAAIRFLLRNVRATEAETQMHFLLGRVVGAMKEGMFICDERGRIVYANERFCDIVGRPHADLLLQSAGDHFFPMYSQFLEVRNRGERECRFGADWRDACGATRTLRVTGELVESDDHEYLGCYGIVQDLTGRSQSEAALNRSQNYSTQLSAQLLAAQEAERQRIARELQEGIGEALGGVKFGLETCAELISKGDTQSATGVARVLVTKIQSAVEEVRRISMNLHPSTLDDLGVLATIGWVTREFQGAYPHLDLQVTIDACEEEIPAAAKGVIYRIVQEALQNIVSHAQARTVALSLKAEKASVELAVRDDGVGFEQHVATALDASQGLGLASMRERAEATGGEFTVETAPGRGTAIHVIWPCACPRARVSETDA